MAVHIQERHRKVLREDIPPLLPKLARLELALSSLPATLTTERVIQFFAKEVDISEEMAQRVLDLLLYSYSLQDDEPTARISRAMGAHIPAGAEEFSGLIERALAMERGFGLFAKAMLLRHDNASVLSGTRIITDLRPAFRPQSTSPMGITIQHTLRLSAMEDSDARDYYFTASQEQLRKLRTAIERAMTKAEELRKAPIQQLTFVED